MPTVPPPIASAEALALSILDDEGPTAPQVLIQRMREREPRLSESLAVHALWRLNNARRIYLNAHGRLLTMKSSKVAV